jgi:hypothetical protein
MSDPATNSQKPATKATKKQVNILQAKSDNPGLTTRQIAKLADTDHTHVVKTLQRYGVDYGAVESYQKHRADILDGVAHRIIASITDADIKNASLLQRLSAYGIVYDKMRIERGLADGSSKPLVLIQVNGQAPTAINAQHINNNATLPSIDVCDSSDSVVDEHSSQQQAVEVCDSSTGDPSD